MKDMEASEMVAIPVSESKESPQSTMTPNPVPTDDGVSVKKGATPIPTTSINTLEESNGEVVATNVEAMETDRETEGNDMDTLATNKEAVQASKETMAANVDALASYVEAVTTNLEPVVTKKDTVSNNTEPVVAKEDTVTTNSEPVVTNGETVVAKEDTVTTNSEPVVTNGETLVEENKESLAQSGEKAISQLNVGIKRTKGSLRRDLKKIRLFKDSDEEDNPDDPDPLPQVNSNRSNDKIQNELQKKIERIPQKSREMEKAQTEGIMILDDANEVLEANDDKENTYKKQETKLKKKLRKLSRKELENLIIKQLNRKLMASEHELGKLKQLSEKLKYTLENNKKKTAQFYKEVDDLKKVTQKLMQDHEARKGQYVTPIRTQRSVGIHANEKYIRQGSMFVSNGTGPYRTISPSPGLSKIQLASPAISNGTPGVSPSQGTNKASQPTTQTTSAIQTQTAQPVAASTLVQTYGVGTAPTSSGNPQILRQTIMVQPPTSSALVTSRPPMVSIPRPTMAPMVSIPRPPIAPMVQVPISAVTGGINNSNTNTVNSVGSSLMSVGANRISAQIVTPPQGNAMQNAHQQMISQQNQQMISQQNQHLMSQQTPIAAANISNPVAFTPISTARTNISSEFVDLTEGNLGNQTSTIGNLQVHTTPNTVVNATAPGIGTSVRPALIQTPGGGTQQVYLVQQLPANGSIPNTLLVSNAGSTVTTGLTTSFVSPTIGNNQLSTLNNPPSVIGGFKSISAASPPAGAQVAAATAVATATSQAIYPRHPAPLPAIPAHLLSLIKHSPPILTLKKVPEKENSIILSWNMSKLDDHSCVGHYHLFSYQEGTAAPTPKLWKKVGMVQALELPMACTLTQFTPGFVYHFAVRAVYSAGRVGPFSEPRSIHLAR